MNTSTKLASSITLALGITSIATYAATPPTGSQLTINPGATASSVFVTGSGSYFAMDTNGNAKVVNSEKVPLSQGTTGLVIGVVTSFGSNHAYAPTSGDTNDIDAPWNFFGNTGSDYVRTAVTGSTTSGLDFSGWTVAWNGIQTIPMGTDAWATGTGTGPHTGATGTFANGIANFTWDGTNGGAYSLDYRATVPAGDPSGFGGVKYELHLEGVVNLPQGLTATAGALADGDLGGSAANSYRPTTTPPADTGFTNQGGYFDFKNNCGGAGCTGTVVIPLTGAIPVNAVLRKYNPNTGLWSTFDTLTDMIESADKASGGGNCVAATYSAGLTAGHDCLRLTQAEGGLNDTDSTPNNGVYGDPSGLAVVAAAPTITTLSPSGSGGCVIANRPVSSGISGEWLLVGAALAGLGLFRRRVF